MPVSRQPRALPPALASVFAQALARHRAGALAEAEALYRQVLAAQPRHADSLHLLGVVALQSGQPEQAMALIGQAIGLDVKAAAYHASLGSVLGEQGRLDEAVCCFRRALALQPEHPTAHYNLGNALREQGSLEEAIACYRKTLAAAPDHAKALNNLATSLRERGRLEEAAHWFRRAIALQPQEAKAHYNLALVLLAQGAFSEGWAEYEWRWQTPQFRGSQRRFAQPQWRGEPAAGQTLLIHAEQGFGDTLQFGRYATLAAARGLRVVLQVQPPLVRLLQSLDGVDQVLPNGADLPNFDWHCPMLSLPGALGTTLETIPASPAYLRADAAAWRARLAALPGRRVGLVWAGSASLGAVDRRRSLPPELLLPLRDIPGLVLFSLQKGGPPAPAELGLRDHMAEMADFADTAALVAALDLVISVDTAVAHLAAALGVPVWLLDRFDPCWRWLDARRDSPWYPTLRLYRQPNPADWPNVLSAVVEDLTHLAAEPME